MSDEKLRTSASIPIEGVPFDFKGNRDKLKKACDKSRKFANLSESDKSVLHSASTAIVDAWRACMGDRSRTPRFSLEQGSELAKIIGHISNESRQVGDARLKGTITLPEELNANSCTCDQAYGGRCERTGTVITIDLPQNGSTTLRCTRAKPGPILIHPSFNIQMEEARLPAVAQPRLGMVSETTNVPGRCTGQHRSGQEFTFQFEAQDLLLESLPVTIRRVGSTPSGTGQKVVDLLANCDAAKHKCETKLYEKDGFWLTGTPGMQRRYGLWIDFPETAAPDAKSFQLIGQQGNKNCKNAAIHYPGVTIVVNQVSLWKPDK